MTTTQQPDYQILQNKDIDALQAKVVEFVRRGYQVGNLQIINNNAGTLYLVPIVLTEAEIVRVATMKIQQVQMETATGMFAEQVNIQARSEQRLNRLVKATEGQQQPAGGSLQFSELPEDIISITTEDFIEIEKALVAQTTGSTDLVVKIRKLIELGQGS